MARLLEAAVPPSTFRKYKSAFAHWADFLSASEDPVNLTADRYGAYLEHAVEAGKSISFIETVTAAISPISGYLLLVIRLQRGHWPLPGNFWPLQLDEPNL